MRVVDLIAQEVARAGTRAVFGLMGHGNLQVILELVRRQGIAYYGARHECGAVAMADAYARVSGRVGVCTVSHGPGFTNAITALIEAHKGGTPLVMLAGDTGAHQTSHNQNVNQCGLMEPIGVRTEVIRRADEAAEVIRRSFAVAAMNCCPVVIDIPTDMQDAEAPEEPPKPSPGAASARAGAELSVAKPDTSSIRAAADLLASAAKPLILAGRGAVRAGARQALEAIGDRIGALFATSALAKGLFADNPFQIGIAGGFSSVRARRLMAQADVALVFGASLNDWTTRDGQLFSHSCKVIQCDVDAAAVGRNVQVTCAVVGDARVTARELYAEVERRGISGEGFRTKAVRAELRDGLSCPIPPHQETGTIHPRRVLQCLDRVLPRERTVVIDSGNFMGYPAMELTVPDPYGFVMAQSFMSLGLGLAGAIGAAVASPERLPVAVVGDGGLLMSLGELDTVCRYGFPVLIVVMNDAAYGAEVDELEALEAPTGLAKFDDVDFAALARSFGARGMNIRRPGDLEGIGQWLSERNGPLLLDCKLDPTVRATYWD